MACHGCICHLIDHRIRQPENRSRVPTQEQDAQSPQQGRHGRICSARISRTVAFRGRGESLPSQRSSQRATPDQQRPGQVTSRTRLGRAISGSRKMAKRDERGAEVCGCTRSLLTCAVAAALVLVAAGDFSCAECPDGEFRSGCGDGAEGTCEPCNGCPQGQYRRNCTGTNAGSCDACPSGTYKNDTGPGGCITCTPSCGAVVAGVGDWYEVRTYRSGCGGISAGSCLPCDQCVNWGCGKQCGWSDAWWADDLPSDWWWKIHGPRP